MRKPSKELRALRLHHWRKAVSHRSIATAVLFPTSIEWHNRRADFHIKAVQTLNDYFEPGDTAEKDAEKCE